jgi:hypothetical protein
MDLQTLHSTILADQTEEDSRHILNAMEKLFTTEGWNILAKYLEIFYRSEIASIASTPLPSVNDILPQEYKKGTCSAILLLLQLPEMLKLNAENNLQMVGKQQEALGDDDGWSTEQI